jgi:hypothetical protein
MPYTLMPRLLIEVEDDEDAVACTKAFEVFLRSGSHFLTHADGGCKDNEHKAWILVELDSRGEALNIVPADFRGRARVIQLNKFVLEKAESGKEKVRAK